jgi:hypothetical protein
MIETLCDTNGHARLWGDGSPVMVVFDDDGDVDWAKTREANPWPVKREQESSVPAKQARLSTAIDRIRARLEEHRCPDCKALPGHEHDPGCDVEQCPFCGSQILSCDCSEAIEDGYEPMRWTGTWPGVKECIEYDFWCRWKLFPPSAQLDFQTSGWVRCAKEEPGARVDLNRLGEECTWDKVQRRWVRASLEKASG